jgi:hypothetical protein
MTKSKIMRWWVLILLVFMPFTALSHAAGHKAASVPDGTLIRSINLEGFVLGDKSRFDRIFKPYRNKYLTSADMDDILHKIQAIYEREGYQQLVSISYQVVKKHRLVFTALMIT